MHCLCQIGIIDVDRAKLVQALQHGPRGPRASRLQNVSVRAEGRERESSERTSARVLNCAAIACKSGNSSR